MSRRAAEDGRITLLSIALLSVVLLLSYAVAAATSVHLQRKELQALTETLAVRAAGAVSHDEYLAAGRGAPVLTDAAARRAVDAHLAAAGAAGGVRVVQVRTAEDSVTVVTSAVAVPPFIPEWLWPVALGARADARLYGSG